LVNEKKSQESFGRKLDNLIELNGTALSKSRTEQQYSVSLKNFKIQYRNLLDEYRRYAEVAPTPKLKKAFNELLFKVIDKQEETFQKVEKGYRKILDKDKRK
jgi:hypothetical protein